MYTTKHDLSAGEVKIDYEAIYQTACAAFYQLRERIQLLLSYSYDMTGDYFSSAKASINLKEIKGLANQLAVAGETIYALKKGLEREEKKIVNVKL